MGKEQWNISHVKRREEEEKEKSVKATIQYQEARTSISTNQVHRMALGTHNGPRGWDTIYCIISIQTELPQVLPERKSPNLKIFFLSPRNDNTMSWQLRHAQRFSKESTPSAISNIQDKRRCCPHPDFKGQYLQNIIFSGTTILMRSIVIVNHFYINLSLKVDYFKVDVKIKTQKLAI